MEVREDGILTDWWTALGISFAAGLFVRLVMARSNGFWTDVDTFRRWTGWLLQYGIHGFYAHAGEPIDYPPGFLFFLWAYGRMFRVIGWGVPPSVFATRLPPIAFDLVLAGVAARLGAAVRRDLPGFGALVAASVLLLNPAFFFTSAGWGQVDGLGAALALAGIGLVVRGGDRSETAGVVVFAISLLTKPLTVFAAIPAGIVLLRRHTRPSVTVRRLGWLAFVAADVLFLAFIPFSLNLGGLSKLLGAIANKHHDATSFSFNMWALAGWWRPDATVHVLGLPSRLVGLTIVGAGICAIAWATWRLLSRGDSELEVTLLAAAAVSGIAFSFMTRVHERYALFSIAYLAPLLVRRGMRTLAAVMTALCTLNLVYVYWWFNHWANRPMVRMALLQATLFKPGPVKVLGVIGTIVWTIPAVLLVRRAVRQDTSASTSSGMSKLV